MFSTLTPSNTSIGKATDRELFVLMAERGPASNEAWADFYNRYVKDLYRVVCRLRGVEQARIKELVQDTMIQVYVAAHTFQTGDVSDAEISRRRTLAWLCCIAHNLHWSTLRQQKGTPVSGLSRQDGEDDSQLSTKGRRLYPGELHREVKEAEDVVCGDSNDDRISPCMMRLREALDSLTERERDILIATFAYHKRGEKNQRLPNAIVKELCDRYGISRAHLRQLRKRALLKIEQYIFAN
jgi:RNA polymerase sigma factor (sigma-70 family)